MADTFVSNISGEMLLIQFGNGADPEVFTSSATINTTRSLDLSAKASSTEVADVTNPSAPAKTVRQIMSTDLKFDGDGIADAPSILGMIQAWQAGAKINVKIVQNVTGAAGGWTATGPIVITSLSEKGTRGDMQTFSGTFEAADAFTFAANA